MMNKIINAANRNSTIGILIDFQKNMYVPFDVKIINSHIKKINDFVGFKLFKNNSLYINSKTLWELMNQEKGKGSHNFHGLLPEDVYMAINSLKDPKYVFISTYERCSIITIQLSHFEKPLMITIERDSGLETNSNITVNKIVTIYPKDNVDEYIEKRWGESVLYKKV